MIQATSDLKVGIYSRRLLCCLDNVRIVSFLNELSERQTKTHCLIFFLENEIYTTNQFHIKKRDVLRGAES